MITKRDIRVGSIFKLMPGPGSHSEQPYNVKVIEFDSKGFKTELHGPAPETYIPPHERRFNFNDVEWENYHRKRFIPL